MNVLVLGASGMIGDAIFHALSKDYAVYGTYFSHVPDTSTGRRLHFDVSDRNELAAILQEVRPDVIISSLRGDFSDQEKRHKETAEYLLKTGGRLIFLSTANVFDGCPFETHFESDTPYPVSSYGQYKFRCEQMLQKTMGGQLTIVRLPKVLSRARVRVMCEGQTPKQPLTLYTNLYMSLNTDENVAGGVRYILSHGLSGTFHLTSRDFVSYEECYGKIFRIEDRKERTEMSPETYCTELGNVPDDALRGKYSGKIYLELSSRRNELPTEFYPDCKDIIDKLRV